MSYIKVYFKTKKNGKEGKILAVICENKCLANFFNHQQAEMTFKKLISEGKKVFFERGVITQFFHDMSKEQILKLIKEDIILASKDAGVEILDYQEETIK